MVEDPTPVITASQSTPTPLQPPPGHSDTTQSRAKLFGPAPTTGETTAPARRLALPAKVRATPELLAQELYAYNLFYHNYSDPDCYEHEVLEVLCAQEIPAALEFRRRLHQLGEALSHYEALLFDPAHVHMGERQQEAQRIIEIYRGLAQAPFKREFMAGYHWLIVQTTRQLRPLITALTTLEVRTARGTTPISHQVRHHPEHLRGNGDFTSVEVTVHSRAQMDQLVQELESRNGMIVDRRPLNNSTSPIITSIFLYHERTEPSNPSPETAYRKELETLIRARLAGHPHCSIILMRLRILGATHDRSSGPEREKLTEALIRMHITLEDACELEFLAAELICQLDTAIATYGPSFGIVNGVTVIIKFYEEPPVAKSSSKSALRRS